jgi:hypothetical protein
VPVELRSGIEPWLMRRTSLFVEHGLSPEPRVERWQYRLTRLTPICLIFQEAVTWITKMDDLLLRPVNFGPPEEVKCSPLA